MIDALACVTGIAYALADMEVAAPDALAPRARTTGK